jgi:ATP-dependent protease ClpP protease subunit
MKDVVFEVKGEIREGEIVKRLVSAISGATSFLVLIDSEGGDVEEAEEAYNILRKLPIPVTTKAVGACYSAASIILQAGKERIVAENAEVMIHNAWLDKYSGNSFELRAVASMLEAIDERLSLIYQIGSRGKLTADKARSLMKKELFLTAEQSVSYGLADKVVGKEATLQRRRAVATLKIKHTSIMDIKAALKAVSDALKNLGAKNMVTFKVGDNEFTADELVEGAATNAPDGTHTTDAGVIVVADGKIVSITAAAQGAGDSEKEKQIAELMAQVAAMKKENDTYKAEAEAAKAFAQNAKKTLESVQPILKALASAKEEDVSGAGKNVSDLEARYQAQLEAAKKK